MANPTKQPSLTLLSLPNELIDQIFEKYHVSAHFNLALACRRLAECGKPFLQRHKAAYQAYGVVSDLEPLTVPLLLQKVVRDPYVAWNVRSIEIWATRDDWYAWGSIPLEVPAHIAARPMSIIRPYGYNYYWDEIFQNIIDDPPHLTEEQLDIYLDLLREHAHFDEVDLEEARADFSDGADFFYKILLILLCPRLNSFKHVNINDPFIRDYGGKEMFSWLSVIIPRSREKQSWAPGLKSLREVALRVQPGLWFRTGEHSELYPRQVFTSVMMLPNLKSVYLGEFNTEPVGWRPEDRIPTRYCGLSGSSSIEHIFLDHMDHSLMFLDVNQEFFQFLKVPKNLKSLTIGGLFCPINQGKKYIGMDYLGSSLESVIEYSGRNISGLFQPFIMVPISKKLSRMTINIWSFISRLFKTRWDMTHSEMREDWRDSKIRVEIENRLTEAFPKTSEVLLFHTGRDWSKRKITINAEILEEILIQLVRCKEHYPALKAIGIQQQRDDPWQRTFSDYRFSKLVEVCWENGVDAYIRGNLRPLRHQLDMPMQPTISSLRGVEAQGEGTNKTLDPFTGKWVKDMWEMGIEG
ncbi:hypothetical protein DER45DRAFT_647995 [Fusarium avenaceum]|nr:hypothetical protein DER45DRAFT_647995 [Fusarium avenaceum]